MTRYHRIFGLVLVIIAFVGASIAALSLEGPVPVHWNIEGEVDGWMALPWGLLILPGTVLALFLVFQVIGYISPKGFRLESFQQVVGIFQNATLLFMALIFSAQMLFAAGIEVAMDQLIVIATGALFIIIGNFLGKTRKNFFIGIRTPWTLANDEVWLRTHRLGGWVFVAGGFLLLLGGTVTRSHWFLVSVVAVVALVPIVYSFLLYRRLEGFEPEN